MLLASVLIVAVNCVWTVMLLVEMLLVVQEVQLPGWFLPQSTPYDIVSALKRMFPAFMNGCRCIASAYYDDHKTMRVLALNELNNNMKNIGMRISSVGRKLVFNVEQYFEVDDEDEGMGVDGSAIESAGSFCASPRGAQSEMGLIKLALKGSVKRVASLREGRDGTLAAEMEAKVKLISNPDALKRTHMSSERAWAWLITLRNVAIYLLARWLFIKKQVK